MVQGLQQWSNEFNVDEIHSLLPLMGCLPYWSWALLLKASVPSPRPIPSVVLIVGFSILLRVYLTQCGVKWTNLDFHLLISFVILSFFQVITQLNNSYTQPYSYHMEFSPFPFVFVDCLPSSAVFVVGAMLPWLGLGGLWGVTWLDSSTPPITVDIRLYTRNDLQISLRLIKAFPWLYRIFHGQTFN
jgi:hypothetical protein